MGDERLKSLRNVAFSSASWNRCSEHDMIASMKVFVVYSSPAGSTARIARRIADFFRKGGTEEFSVSLYDLGALKFYNEGNKISPLLKEIDAAGENGLLFLGSPVYVGHAVPPVSNFIDLLPSDIGTVFVPFVTWGESLPALPCRRWRKVPSRMGCGWPEEFPWLPPFAYVEG